MNADEKIKAVKTCTKIRPSIRKLNWFEITERTHQEDETVLKAFINKAQQSDARRERILQAAGNSSYAVEITAAKISTIIQDETFLRGEYLLSIL